MILTEIGEMGIHRGARVTILRPSLYAMSKLGTPTEIVEMYSRFATGKATLGDAFEVLDACSPDGDDMRVEVFGQIVPGQRRRKLLLKPGKKPAGHAMILAATLLKHGVVGDVEPLRPRPGDPGPEYTAEFNASLHAADVQAHLGLNEQEAWSMTMTAIILAMRAKFPRPEATGPGAKAPTLEQHDATMAWFDRVQKAKGQ